MAPILWVGTEWLRGTLFTGFPWVLLGYSQSDTVAPLQVASLVGIYGLSGLVACPSAALALLMTPDPRRSRSRLLAAALLMALADRGHRVGRVARGARGAAAGPHRARGARPGQRPAGAEMGPRVPRRHPVEIPRADARCRATGRRSRHLAGVVDAVRVRPRRHPDRGHARRRCSRRGCRSSSAATRWSGPKEFYNAAFVMDADGEIRGSYRKMQLVPVR